MVIETRKEQGEELLSLKELICDSRKIVVKIGSNTLSDEHGAVNRSAIHNLTEQLVEWMKEGKSIIIVSSGAGVCGAGAINKWARRKDINYKQALCAIGQVELMMAYKELFGEYGYHVGQMLLTRDDFNDHSRNLHIRNTLFTLVDEGVIPIINENDTVSVDEIKIGDNDTLGAMTANLWGADLLIVLSDIDGVYDKNPKEHPSAEIIRQVTDIDFLKSRISMEGTNRFGTGGVATKIEAARRVNEFGIPMALLNGKKENILRKAAEGSEEGTVFYG